ncbi:MAG TPA: sigma-54 dependent transcriptional regulator, partial [Verrucomicrobiae bacterium]|nr:sigma-54 dependent transcriptional regulator [Verrucomicrobiae bacterium]
RLPVVVMTAWSSVELAVAAIRHGAGDFLEKPWNNERMLSIVRNQIELGRAQRNTQRLEAAQRLQFGDGTPALIAESAAMRPVLEIISRVGPSDAAILITGENGTGKGLVARALHAISGRKKEPLVSINMGGISENLFESELFGHVKGAFTDAKTDRMGRLEMAEGGTLFLDEIANMPPGQQAKMLRVLETNEYERVGSSKTKRANVRFISATNADLEDEVDSGRFRRDLMFRLNTVEIRLPALRDRLEDIEPLANFFLSLHQQKHRKPPGGFHPNAIDLMKRHAWPGNVRELSHAVERALLMASGDLIQAADLGLQPAREGSAGLEDMSLDEVERYLIKRTLARCDGSALEAAKALGLSRSAFYRRLEKYGL